jgi:hypothetical protein
MECREEEEQGFYRHLKEEDGKEMKNVELLNIYHLYGKPELNWAVIN